MLYRYFFFSWLFKDATKGSVFEKAAALRWNKEHAHWLYNYLRRWAFLMVFFFLLGALTEQVFPLVSALFYIPSAVSIAVQTVIGVMIAWLKLLP